MSFKKKVLKNGLRIIAIPIKDAPSVTVMSLIEAGSKYETKEKNGISHFLEHMCFKATEKRPNSIDISREFDEMGSDHNAFTGYEYTCYYGKAHPKHLEKLLDLTADMYLNPTFPSAEIEKEKGVIIEEINMYDDLPNYVVQEVFHELMYGDEPVGWNITGPRENVRSFNREDFVNYRKNHYVSSATALIVAGDIDPKIIFEKVENAFAQVSAGKKADKKRVIENQTEPGFKLKFKDIDQAHIVIGVRTFDIYDKRSITLGLLSVILGKGMSSRLFQKMRDDLGICYYISADSEKFTDHGYLSISAGLDKTRMEEGIKGILNEMKKIRDEDVPDSELRKAKDFYLGHLYLGLESSDSLAGFYGAQEILKQEIKTPKEIEDEIQKVTVKDIKKVAGEIMMNEKLNMAVVGKYTEEEAANFKKIFRL